MSQGTVNVLNLAAKGRASISEKGGVITVRAGDPVSALQAIATRAAIKIELSPAEVERFSGAGRLDISLSYANDFSGAMEAVKQIDRLAAEASAAGDLKKKKKRTFWKALAWLVLAVALGAVGFAATVAVLDIAHGSRTLPHLLKK